MIACPTFDRFNEWAVDPYVLPGKEYVYWVEALMPGSGATAPSPISRVTIGVPSVPLANLQATVSGTKSIVLPGVLSVTGPRQGSDVTWTWDAQGYAFSYEASYEIVGGVQGLGPVFERFRVPTVQSWSGGNGPGSTFSPVIRGVPQGATVKFCVALFAEPDMSKPLPTNYATCRSTQVP